jgi:hypothetical protein
MGINIFQNNICLLDLYGISELKKEIIIRVDIFVYAHIIESQDIPRPQIDLIHQSSDEEAVSFDLALRQTVEGIRSFWRQNDYPAFRYPLASLCQTIYTGKLGKSWGLMPSDRTTIENLLRIHDYKFDMLFFSGIESRIPRDVVRNAVLPYNKEIRYPRSWRLVRSIYLTQVQLIANIRSPIGAFTTHPFLRPVKQLHGVGEFVARIEFRNSQDPQLDAWINLVGSMIEMLHNWMVDRTFTQPIHRKSVEAFSDCFSMITKSDLGISESEKLTIFEQVFSEIKSAKDNNRRFIGP